MFQFNVGLNQRDSHRINAYIYIYLYGQQKSISPEKPASIKSSLGTPSASIFFKDSSAAAFNDAGTDRSGKAGSWWISLRLCCES